MPALRPHHLDRAFELAAFLHDGERDVARSVVQDALDKLDVAGREQDKRRYYRAERRRTKVSLSDPHLLQFLTCYASEPYEHRREDQGDVTDADLLVRYLALLVRFCISRNSFHLTVGLHRLWYDYDAEEVRRLYDLLRQDPDQAKEESAFRACKKKIFDRLRSRFGERLATERGARGVITPVSHPDPEPFHPLAHQALELLIPWETDCVLPEIVDPYDELSCLQSPGLPDDENRYEMNRIHALLHVSCLRRLTLALGVDPPEQRLRLPDLKASERDRGSSRKSEPLSESEIAELRDEVKRREKLRRRRATGLLSARLNGRETARWDPAQDDAVEIAFDETSDCLEIWDLGAAEEEDLLLGVHLFAPDAVDDPPDEVVIRPAHGRLLRLRLAPRTSRFTPAKVRISYRERRFQARLELLRRSADLRGGALLRPALATTITAILIWFGVQESSQSVDPDLRRTDPVLRSESEYGSTAQPVCRVAVGDLNSGSQRRDLTERIGDLLQADPEMRYEEDLEQADALLKLSPDQSGGSDLESGDLESSDSESPDHLPVRMRLTAPDGTILWAAQFEGGSEDIASDVVEALKTLVVCENESNR